MNAFVSILLATSLQNAYVVTEDLNGLSAQVLPKQKFSDRHPRVHKAYLASRKTCRVLSPFMDIAAKASQIALPWLPGVMR